MLSAKLRPTHVACRRAAPATMPRNVSTPAMMLPNMPTPGCYDESAKNLEIFTLTRLVDIASAEQEELSSRMTSISRKANDLRKRLAERERKTTAQHSERAANGMLERSFKRDPLLKALSSLGPQLEATEKQVNWCSSSQCLHVR